MAKRARCHMQSTSDKQTSTRKSHVAKELQLYSYTFLGRQSKLRGRGCAKHLGRFTLFSCLFTMPRSWYVFLKTPCISVLRLRNHTLSFLPLVFLFFLFVVFDLLVCPLSRYFLMFFRNFFLPSKEFLVVFVRHTLLFAYS